MATSSTRRTAAPQGTTRRIRPALALSIGIGVFAIAGCGSDSAKKASETVSTAISQPSAPTVANTAATAGTSTATVAPAESSPSSAAAATTPPSAAAAATTTSASVAEVSSSVAATGSADPCRLLTADEAVAALGGPVMPANKTVFDAGPYGTASDCSYTAVDNSAGPTSVHIGVLGQNVPADQWEQAERAEGYEEVPGLGDLAFFNSDNEEIDVLSGGSWVNAQLINTNEAQLLADLTDIVRRALDRL